MKEKNMGAEELNRLQKRGQILTQYKEFTIPTICMDWRMSLTGCADPWPDEENLKIYRFLKCCLDTWEPSLQDKDNKFDDAVKQLIEATLAEAHYYWKEFS